MVTRSNDGTGARRRGSGRSAPAALIGGGVSVLGELVLGPARRRLDLALPGRGFRPGPRVVVAELGYTEDDVPALVDGALKQQRLLKVAPRQPDERDLGHIITASMHNW